MSAPLSTQLPWKMDMAHSCVSYTTSWINIFAHSKQWSTTHQGHSSHCWLRWSWIDWRCLSGKGTLKNSDVPHYTDILKFIDLRARASNTFVCEPPKCHSQSALKNNAPIRMTYVARIDTACMSFSVGKHHLYVNECRKVKLVSSERHMNLVREHQLCFNCPKFGHFVPQCASDHNCQKCCKPHHTLLQSSFERDSVAKMANQDAKQPLPTKRDDPCTSHSSHLSSPNLGGQQSPLMMTCQKR